jgi:Predicted hydrolase (metallo-beta-lactamase superfamily)
MTVNNVVVPIAAVRIPYQRKPTVMSKIRLFSLILAILTVFSAFSLSSCGKNPPDGGQTETEETTVEATEPPASTTLCLLKDKEPLVRVIRPEGAAAESETVSIAKQIVKSFSAFTESIVELSTDWTKDGVHDSESLEILVGNTDYAESAEVLSTLNYGEYAVKAVGNKIVVAGYTDTAISRAGNIIIDTIIQAGIAGGKTTVEIPRDISYSGKANADLAEIPVMEGDSLSATYYNPGDSCSEMIIGNTSREDYDRYLQKIESLGFTKAYSNDITENSFATFYNDKYTLNVGFYKYNLQTRIILEKYSEPVLKLLTDENKTNVVTTSQISMLGLEYKKSDGTYAGNGLSILIRLTDGRFIVVDGGFNRAAQANLLVDTMKDQSKDYLASTGGRMRIAAWIITHAHGDHDGMIVKQYSVIKNAGIIVENFLCNFMSDTERNLAINSYLKAGKGNWSEGEGGNWTQVYDAASALGANMIITHVGHEYNFADAKLEVLYTIESFGPALCNALNTTSLIIKMTFKDPVTGKETVYMSTGDATGNGFEISKKMYGSYLKSDLLQVAHHGGTTWGNDKGTMDAYKAISPATLVWPMGQVAYPSYKTKTHNTVLFSPANPNFKEVYIAGPEGSVTVFPLPYTVGSAVANKKPLQ